MTKSRVAQARRASYASGRLLGDVRAVQTGRIGQRLWNLMIWKAFAQLMRTISKRGTRPDTAAIWVTSTEPP